MSNTCFAVEPGFLEVAESPGISAPSVSCRGCHALLPPVPPRRVRRRGSPGRPPRGARAAGRGAHPGPGVHRGDPRPRRRRLRPGRPSALLAQWRPAAVGGTVGDGHRRRRPLRPDVDAERHLEHDGHGRGLRGRDAPHRGNAAPVERVHADQDAELRAAHRVLHGPAEGGRGRPGGVDPGRAGRRGDGAGSDRRRARRGRRRLQPPGLPERHRGLHDAARAVAADDHPAPGHRRRPPGPSPVRRRDRGLRALSGAAPDDGRSRGRSRGRSS